MESRREQAIQYFKKGYNCSQSVILAHSDLFDIDREALLKLVQPFGGGMGRLRQVCGAVSAMFMVAGALEGSAVPGDAEGKKKTYAIVQKLAKEFEKKNGSIVCGQLLGLSGRDPLVKEEYRQGATPEPRTEEYYKRRPCPEIIGDACDILAKCLRWE